MHSDVYTSPTTPAQPYCHSLDGALRRALPATPGWVLCPRHDEITLIAGRWALGYGAGGLLTLGTAGDRAGGFHVLVQELERCAVRVDVVLLLDEPVPLIGKHHVLGHAAAAAHGLHDLIGFDLQDPGIVRTLQHQHGLADPRRVKQGRDAIQPHAAAPIGIANFGEERLAERLPPGRDAAERAHPIRAPEDVETGGERVRPEGHCGKGEIAAVAATRHRYAARVHVAQACEGALRPP